MPADLRPVDRIEQIVKEHDIACNFRRLDAFLFAHGTKKSPRTLYELTLLRPKSVLLERICRWYYKQRHDSRRGHRTSHRNQPFSFFLIM